MVKTVNDLSPQKASDGEFLVSGCGRAVAGNKPCSCTDGFGPAAEARAGQWGSTAALCPPVRVAGTTGRGSYRLHFYKKT